MSMGMLEILCRGVGFIIVWRVWLFATSSRLVFTSIPTSLSSSLPLLVIGGGLIREVMLSVGFSLRIKRS